MSFASCDWRYELPCDTRILPSVRRRLSPWLARLLSADCDKIHAALRRRWKKMPAWLRPQRDTVLRGSAPALIGDREAAFLELTLGASKPRGDLPWIPRPWRTLGAFLPGPARAHIKRKGWSRAKIEAMGLDTLEWRVEMSWGDSLGVAGKPSKGDEDRWEWSLHVAAPESRSTIAHCLHRLGISHTAGVEPFLTTGRAGWMMHEEARIDPRWRSFPELIEHYTDQIEYRWPFDGYGRSEEAIQARQAREKGPARGVR